MGRVVPGIIMAAAWLLILLLGSPGWFWVVVVALATLGLSEYFHMTDFGLDRGSLAATLMVVLLPVLAAFDGSLALVFAGSLCSFFCLILLVLKWYTRLDDVFAYFTGSTFALLYIAVCLAHLALLRSLPGGGAWIVILTGMTAGSDTGAYYCGRYFGKTKLCPNISPNKTREGALGGIICGVLVGLVFYALLPVQTSLFSLILAAPILVLIGIVGDLVESVIKRSVGSKDSGHLLGGHGGVLDRLDSLLLTCPVLFYLLYFGVL